LETYFITVENPCWVLKNVQQFLFQETFNLLNPVIEQEKYVVGKHWLPKRSTIVIVCLPFSVVSPIAALDEVTLSLVQVDNSEGRFETISRRYL